MPKPLRRGRRPSVDLRTVLDAIRHMAPSGGCQWRMLPPCLPPVSTVRGYFFAWRNAGLLESINHILMMTAREMEGHEAPPSAGIIDSQSVKTTESGGVSGYDAGKKVKGRKRHIFADGGYAGDKLREAMREHGDWTMEIVKRSGAAKGFVVLPRRWVVERTFAWLNRRRRLAKDFERSIENATAFVHIASIRMLTCQIARQWNAP